MLAGTEAERVLIWWLSSSPWDVMAGTPSGPPQWPKGRGLLETPNRLTGLVDRMREEWACRKRARPEPSKP